MSAPVSTIILALRVPLSRSCTTRDRPARVIGTVTCSGFYPSGWLATAGWAPPGSDGFVPTSGRSGRGLAIGGLPSVTGEQLLSCEGLSVKMLVPD